MSKTLPALIGAPKTSGYEKRGSLQGATPETSSYILLVSRSSRVLSHHIFILFSICKHRDKTALLLGEVMICSVPLRCYSTTSRKQEERPRRKAEILSWAGSKCSSICATTSPMIFILFREMFSGSQAFLSASVSKADGVASPDSVHVAIQSLFCGPGPSPSPAKGERSRPSYTAHLLNQKLCLSRRPRGFVGSLKFQKC